MYCNACGSQLPEGTKFCSHCGASQIQQQSIQKNEKIKSPKKKGPKVVVVLIGVVVLLLVVVMGLFFTNMLSMNSLLSSVVAVDMTKYVSFEEDRYTLVGESRDGYDVEFENQIIDKVKIDKEEYYIRNTNFNYNESENKKIGLICTDKNGDLLIYNDELWEDYDYTDEDYEYILDGDPSLWMPGKLRLNKTYEFEQDDYTTECTLIAFETIRISAGKFKNTAVLEWVYDYDDGSPYKEIVHYAKGIGEVKVEGYYWDEEDEEWIDDYELELE